MCWQATSSFVLQDIATEIFAFEKWVMFNVHYYGDAGYDYALSQWNLFMDGVRDERLGENGILLIDWLGYDYKPVQKGA